VVNGLALTCKLHVWHSWEGPETATGAYGNYCKPVHTVHVVNIFSFNFISIATLRDNLEVWNLEGHERHVMLLITLFKFSARHHGRHIRFNGEVDGIHAESIRLVNPASNDRRVDRRVATPRSSPLSRGPST
jgi:hypothetical protein